MGSTFSGPITSTNGFIGNLTGNVTGTVTGSVAGSTTTVTAATTTDIGAVTTSGIIISGNTTITGLGTVAAGTVRRVKFTGTPLLTYNATSLILPTAANIQVAANDCAVFTSLGSGNWVCNEFSPATGLSPALYGLGSTVLEIDQVCDVSARLVAAGSSLTVTAALHAGRIIKLDTASGSTCTLPAATGTGNVYRFMTTVLATSNSHIIKVANGTDVMTGSLNTVDNADGTCTVFGTVAASDTITLNRTTTGSVKVGELITIVDAFAGFFSVQGTVIATGSEATPFSATV